MPYKIGKKGDKYRILKKSTGGIAKNKSGTAVDGGGKKSKAALTPQLQAMNISYTKNKK